MSGPPDTPRRSATFWVGVIGAGVTAFAGMVGAHNGSVWRLPSVLDARVEQALLAADFGGLEVEMDGQRALLRGLVPDEGAIAAAARVALGAAGAGGPWAGGVTAVDVSGVEVGRVDTPYYWRAWREDGRVVLEGAAPSEHARERLMDSARAAFPNARVVDGMHVAGGAASPRFTDMASAGIRAIAGLNSGEVRIADAQIVFIGDGRSEGADALKRAFADPPAPFRARIDVTVDGIDLAHPELQGLNLQRGDADTCSSAFDRLMERNVINFASNSAAVDPSSRQILNALASVALRCDRFSIEVAGHTDSLGAHDLNMDLSKRRAEAVANYLASQGVARARLSARGYGSDRPRASNATPEGQAANRRIEFNVAG